MRNIISDKNTYGYEADDSRAASEDVIMMTRKLYHKYVDKFGKNKLFFSFLSLNVHVRENCLNIFLCAKLASLLPPVEQKLSFKVFFHPSKLLTKCFTWVVCNPIVLY